MSTRTHVQNLFTTIARFRLALIVTLCLVAAALAVLIAVPHGTAAGNPCSPPGVVVVTDPAGDQTAAVTGATSSHDIISVSIAEQYPTSGGQLVITMKVASLSSNPPPNTNWRTFFNATHADGSTTKYFVTATTTNPPALTFKYGFVDTTATGTTNLTVGDADGGSISPADGTLTIVLSMNKLKKPVAGTPNSTLTGPQVDLSAGKLLTAVNGFCSLLVGTGAV